MARNRIFKYPGMTDKAVRKAAEDQAAMLSRIEVLLQQQVEMLGQVLARDAKEPPRST